MTSESPGGGGQSKDLGMFVWRKPSERSQREATLLGSSYRMRQILSYPLTLQPAEGIQPGASTFIVTSEFCAADHDDPKRKSKSSLPSADCHGKQTPFLLVLDLKVPSSYCKKSETREATHCSCEGEGDCEKPLQALFRGWFSGGFHQREISLYICFRDLHQRGERLNASLGIFLSKPADSKVEGTQLVEN